MWRTARNGCHWVVPAPELQLPVGSEVESIRALHPVPLIQQTLQGDKVDDRLTVSARDVQGGMDDPTAVDPFAAPRVALEVEGQGRGAEGERPEEVEVEVEVEVEHGPGEEAVGPEEVEAEVEHGPGAELEGPEEVEVEVEHGPGVEAEDCIAIFPCLGFMIAHRGHFPVGRFQRFLTAVKTSSHCSSIDLRIDKGHVEVRGSQDAVNAAMAELESKISAAALEEKSTRALQAEQGITDYMVGNIVKKKQAQLDVWNLEVRESKRRREVEQENHHENSQILLDAAVGRHRLEVAAYEAQLSKSVGREIGYFKEWERADRESIQVIEHVSLHLALAQETRLQSLQALEDIGRKSVDLQRSFQLESILAGWHAMGLEELRLYSINPLAGR
jgi:hypothetical protein